MHARSCLPVLLGAALAACHHTPRPVAEDPSPAAPAEPPPAALAAPAPPSCARLHPSSGPRPVIAPASGGTIALGRAGDRLLAYVVDEDDRALITVDVDARAELSRVDLGTRPASLLLAGDGRLVVALRDRARLAVYEPAEDPAQPPALRCEVETATEPVGLAVTPDGATLLSVSRFGHMLSIFDLAGLSLRRSVELPRDPQAVIASADGTRAIVSHLAGVAATLVNLDDAAIEPRPLSNRVQEITPSVVHFMPMAPIGDEPPRSSAIISTRHERFGGQGYALARTASGKILMPEVLVETGSRLGRAGGYGDSTSFPTVMADISVLDLAEEKLTVAPVHGSLGSECLLPRAAAIDEEGGEILVACLGLDAVIAYGKDAQFPRIDQRRRFEVASGPTGIAVDPESRRAVAFSQFAGALSVIALGHPRKPGEARLDFSQPFSTERIPIERRSPLDPTLALGRRIFHSAGSRRLSSDGRACASCHPDGRDDGLTWSTPDGPRQTPILLGRLPDTGPYGWDGDRKDLPSHFARTMSRLAGTGLAPSERDALFAYITSLAPPVEPPRPAIAEARVRRGDALFHSEEAGCSTCHLGDELTTDRLRHDVKSVAMGDGAGVFDTPSLRFVGRSAPYFHDGRYPSLVALLEGVDGTMGHTRQLSPDDIASLSAYLESL